LPHQLLLAHQTFLQELISVFRTKEEGKININIRLPVHFKGLSSFGQSMERVARKIGSQIQLGVFPAVEIEKF
jgi:hypothetical protein